ncbi:MAG: hypothetical protein A2133_07730 [Actinobacteria bacterium RBG_16_64_13]|nr:MAG: hypothetical protein A2133_07730 [Actinobacteria bacterium RBG_16_64_13]
MIKNNLAACDARSRSARHGPLRVLGLALTLGLVVTLASGCIVVPVGGYADGPPVYRAPRAVIVAPPIIVAPAPGVYGHGRGYWR